MQQEEAEATIEFVNAEKDLQLAAMGRSEMLSEADLKE